MQNPSDLQVINRPEADALLVSASGLYDQRMLDETIDDGGAYLAPRLDLLTVAAEAGFAASQFEEGSAAIDPWEDGGSVNSPDLSEWN